jgi:hypothetical protein
VLLAPRLKLTGRALLPSGAPLGGVTVTPGVANVGKLTSAASLAALNQLGDTLSAADGRFALLLDAGAYDIGFVPDPSTGTARSWLTGQEVVADTDLGDRRMPVGVAVQPFISGPMGALASAEVRVYVVPVGNFACNATELACLAPPRLVAQATTDGNGRGALLLPAGN